MGIACGETCVEPRNGRGIGKVALGHDQPIRHRHLSPRFLEAVELVAAVDGIHHGDNAAQAVVACDCGVETERRGDRPRIGDAGGLDDDACECREFAAHAAVVETFQCLLQRVPERTAQAAGVEQHDVVLVAATDQEVVEPGLAQLVYHDRRIGERRLAQQTREQRGLAAPQKSGQHVDRQWRHGYRAPTLAAGAAALPPEGEQ